MTDTVIPTDAGRDETEPEVEPVTTVPVMLAPPLVGPPGAGCAEGDAEVDGDVGEPVELLFPQAPTESESAINATVENAV